MNNQKETQLSMAGNIVIPCGVTLEKLGYTIINDTLDNEEIWVAEKEGNKYLAYDPCQLLGLVRLVEIYGREWQVSDEQIDDFINRFYRDA